MPTRPIKLRIYTRYQPNKVHATPHIVGETHLAQNAKIELTLLSQRTGKTQATKTIHRIGRQEISFNLKNTPSGCCTFKATFIDKNGTPYNTEILYDKAPAPTPWLGSQEGISSKVPSPWTPLRVTHTQDHLEITCWNRTHHFTLTTFAKQIQAAQKNLLAAPIRPIARINGKAARWTTGQLELISQNKDKTTFTQHLESPTGISFTTRTEFDFDGLARIDWTLSTTKVNRLDHLALEIPIKKQHAKYLYHFPGQWGGVRNVGALPQHDLTLPFRPYIWIGDEERGLSWFSETDKNIFVENPNCVTEVIHKRNNVLLRINLVTTPIKLIPGNQTGNTFTGHGETREPLTPGGIVTSNLRYTFGLQATPVKPVTEDAWDHRILCIGQATAGFRPRLNVSNQLLDNLVKSGVRTLVLFEHWADAEGYVQTPHAAALKKIIKAAHKRGLKVLLYFSFLASDIAPEWDTFGKDSIILPKGGYPIFAYHPQPEQAAWRVCLNSPWQDLVVDGIAKAMDQYDLDGIYLDGTEYPFGCCNTEHGCGHVKPDGSIAQTYPIFGVRSAMRRLYHAVRSRKPNGQLNVHNSTCMTMPTLGWATSYWDGEQFQNTGKGTDVGQLLPLDAFRAEFMGHQWGVPAEFLYAGNAYTFEQSWSFALLHDIPVRPLPHFYADEPDQTEEHLALTSAIWNIMDTFGRKQAQWLPYWRNKDLVQTSPENVHTSLYRHPQNGILAVVSNQSGKACTLNLSFNLKRLGLTSSTPTITDALENKPVASTGPTLRLNLPYLGWKLLWIR